MSRIVNTAGMSRAEVFMRLYNATTVVPSADFGPGMLHRLMPQPMTLEWAQRILDANQAQHGNLDFEYMNGRPLKFDLTGDLVDVWRYEHTHGVDVAVNALGCPVVNEGAADG